MLHLLAQEENSSTRGNSMTMGQKVWKTKPPGREQVELERMFKHNEIDASATPDSVKRRNDLFRDFSSPVFATHFRKTRAKMGLSATVSNVYNGSSIPELGALGTRDRSRSPPKMLSHFTDSNRSETSSTITHDNSPCWTWVYTDHDKQKDLVCVAIPAVCGKNAKFSIAEDGMEITIAYDWPEVLFKSKDLFSQSKTSDGKKLPMNHQKVHSFVSHLNDSGVTEKSTLKSTITINLPERVQRENDSWTMEKVIVSNTKVIILEFSAFQKSLIIKDADTSLDF